MKFGNETALSFINRPDILDKYKKAQKVFDNAKYAESFEARPKEEQDALNKAFTEKSQVMDFIDDNAKKSIYDF